MTTKPSTSAAALDVACPRVELAEVELDWTPVFEADTAGKLAAEKDALIAEVVRLGAELADARASEDAWRAILEQCHAAAEKWSELYDDLAGQLAEESER